MLANTSRGLTRRYRKLSPVGTFNRPRVRSPQFLTFAAYNGTGQFIGYIRAVSQDAALSIASSSNTEATVALVSK
jgi:hypothetical protein